MAVSVNDTDSDSRITSVPLTASVNDIVSDNHISDALPALSVKVNVSEIA